MQIIDEKKCTDKILIKIGKILFLKKVNQLFLINLDR